MDISLALKNLNPKYLLISSLVTIKVEGIDIVSKTLNYDWWIYIVQILFEV